MTVELDRRLLLATFVQRMPTVGQRITVHTVRSLSADGPVFNVPVAMLFEALAADGGSVFGVDDAGRPVCCAHPRLAEFARWEPAT